MWDRIKLWEKVIFNEHNGTFLLGKTENISTELYSLVNLPMVR
jgi:hypothetical protein